MSAFHRLFRAPSTGTRACIAFVAAAACPGLAAAQGAGSWLLRGGATTIQPQVQSGDLSTPSTPRSQADLESDTQATAGITYMITDRWALDLPLSAGFKHDLVGAGALAGVGRLAEVKLLPISLMLQWRFGEADAALRPYLGLGPTYARFYGSRSTAALSGITGGSPARPTTLEIESKWTASVQLGAAWRVAPRWQLDAAVSHTPLKTEGRLSTGQTLPMKLDPLSLSLGLAYRF
ncbi:MAG: OmpW family protein [Ideonella sp. WA131b]|jgi:outer membrane protein|nr:OmpW family protein [Ideonella sp. WA131b]